MNCRDDKIAAMLPDYHSGHLGEGERATVDAHLDDCEACRISLKIMGLLSQEKAGESGSGTAGHPSADLLANYQQNPEGLDSGTRDTLKRHLESCRECQFDVEWLGDLERDLRAPAPADARTPVRAWIPRWLRRPLPAYALAAVVLTIGAAWSYRAYHAGRPVGTIYALREMTRSPFTPLEVTRSAANQSVRLAISTHPRVPGREYRFCLTDSREIQTYAVAIKTDFGNPNIIKLDLPTATLNDGRYILILTDFNTLSPTDSTSTRFPFELKTQH